MSAPVDSHGSTDTQAGASALLHQLVLAIDAFERTGTELSLRTEGSPTDPDVAGLIRAVQRLTQRISAQHQVLERGVRQRRDILTNVSHDLRTPLSSMQGYLELLLLRHTKLDANERHAYLEIAARQSERLARLVGDLFQLAELDGDASPLSCEPFALAELMHDVIQKHAPEAQRRQIVLRLDRADQALRVHADIALVERLLTGLVENALRHTPSGGSVTLFAGADAGHFDPSRAEISVRDSGEGIPSADLEGLFDRYDHAQRTLGANATPHGGLGLAIARRIVQLHGGDLQIRSRPGEGTDVRFDLPLAGPTGGQAPSLPGQSPAGAWPSPLADGASQSDRLAALEHRIREQDQALTRSEVARESAEAQLRAIEQRYLLAVRGSQDGLWEWDLVSDRVALSPRWKSMLGFETTEIADDRSGWLARVHPDDRAAFEAALRAHIASPQAQPFDQTVRLLHREGSVRHVLSRGVAIRRADGVPFRVVGIDTDVTRVQRMQTVLDVLAEGTADAHGPDFLSALVRHFGRALDVDLAFIAECIDEPPTRVRTLAVWRSDRGDSSNFDFELSGTPCEAVIQDGKTCFHRSDIERMFPRERGYAAYLGMPIVGSDGRVLGHLAFFDRSPRGDEMLVDSVYKIFLARAAAEMERARKERNA